MNKNASSVEHITKTITIRVYQKDLAKLEAMAILEERTISGQIRMIIKEYLSSNS